MTLLCDNYFTTSPDSYHIALQQVNSRSESDALTAFFVTILILTNARSFYTFDYKSSQYLNFKTVRVFKNVQPLVHLKRYHMQKKREKSAETQVQVM
jgi:hypothetical protein